MSLPSSSLSWLARARNHFITEHGSVANFYSWFEKPIEKLPLPTEGKDPRLTNIISEMNADLAVLEEARSTNDLSERSAATLKNVKAKMAELRAYFAAQYSGASKSSLKQLFGTPEKLADVYKSIDKLQYALDGLFHPKQKALPTISGDAIEQSDGSLIWKLQTMDGQLDGVEIRDEDLKRVIKEFKDKHGDHSLELIMSKGGKHFELKIAAKPTGVLYASYSEYYTLYKDLVGRIQKAAYQKSPEITMYPDEPNAEVRRGGANDGGDRPAPFSEPNGGESEPNFEGKADDGPRPGSK